MPSARQLMSSMKVNTPTRGAVALLLDTATGFGASVAIGEIYTRYNSKWAGKNVAALAGAAGKLGAVALSMSNHGEATMLSTLLNSVGQAGVNAYGLGLGLRHGRKAMGQKAILVPTATDAKAIPGASEMTSMGALGRAPDGAGMPWDEVYRLAKGV